MSTKETKQQTATETGNTPAPPEPRRDGDCGNPAVAPAHAGHKLERSDMKERSKEMESFIELSLDIAEAKTILANMEREWLNMGARLWDLNAIQARPRPQLVRFPDSIH